MANAGMEVEDQGESDIIEIDAGGEIIRSHRSTLCLATGSMFSNLFTKRWDSSHQNNQGRVFLDHDPELIKVIVNHLRQKRIEDPYNPIPPPSAPAGKGNELERLLCYFGLTEYFGALSPFTGYLPKVELVQSGDEVVMLNSNNGIRLEHSGGGRRNSFATLTPSLRQSHVGSFWKVSIISYSDEARLLLGIIGNLNATPALDNNCFDRTCFGWDELGYPVHAGNIVNSNLDCDCCHGFAAGDCLYFRLSENTLSMFDVDANEVYTINGVSVEKPYIHIVFNQKSKLVISALSENERIKFF